MSKYFKILVLAMVAVGLMAGSVFAGSIVTVAKGTAAELIGAAAVVPATQAPISYRPEVDLIAGDTFTLKVTNGKINFTAGTQDSVFVCNGAAAAAMPAAALAASADTLVLVVQAGQSLNSSTLYALQGGLFATPCGGGLLPQPNLEINASSLAGTNVTLEVSASTKAGATAAAQTIYPISNQFTATISPVTSKLDFVTGMKNFVNDAVATFPSSTATRSRAALLLVSNEALPNKIALAGGTAAGCDYNLGANGSFNAKVTGNLTGLASLDYNAGVPTIAIAAADVTAGFKTLPIAGAQIQVCKSTDIAPASATTPTELELVAGGTTVLVTGTRTLQFDAVVAGTWLAARNMIAAGATSHIFQLDATILHVPFIRYKTDGSLDTAIVLQTNEATTGANGVQVVAIDATGVERTLTITGKTEVTEGTPLMILGSEIFSALETAGYTSPTLGGVKTTGVKVLINTTETKVKAYATVNSSTGDPRLVPIRIEGPSSVTTSILR